MSVEEEWPAGDESGDQTVVTITPRWPPRRRVIAAGIVALAAFGLYLMRYSTPDVPPTPTPTIVRPTPLPVLPVEAIVEREALALARGDRGAFMAVQDPDDAGWYQSQQELNSNWGTLPGSGKPFQVADSGKLGDGRVWAEVRQFRHDAYFRETRFYRVRDGVWVRTRPDLSFWGKQKAFDISRFHIMFVEGDEKLALFVVARFEDAYARLCGDLGCEERFECGTTYASWCDQWPHVLTITLGLRPEMSRSSWKVVDQGQRVTITLPSPRTMGVFDLSEHDPTLEHIAYDSLAARIAQNVSGGAGRWSKRSDGLLFFQAIVEWERVRLRSMAVDDSRLRSLAGEDLLPLEWLWNWPREFPFASALLDRMRREAADMIAFIDQAFGPEKVAALLRAFDQAESLPQAIETSLGLRYEDFESRWRTWLRQAGR